jgi:hypothetical protein
VNNSLHITSPQHLLSIRKIIIFILTNLFSPHFIFPPHTTKGITKSGFIANYLYNAIHALILLMHNRNLLLIHILVMNLFLDGDDGFFGEFFVLEHYCGC